MCKKFKGAHTRRLYSVILATINERHISALNKEQKVSFSITCAMHMHYQKHVYHGACFKPQIAFTNLTQTTTPLWMPPIL